MDGGIYTAVEAPRKNSEGMITYQPQEKVPVRLMNYDLTYSYRRPPEGTWGNATGSCGIAGGEADEGDTGGLICVFVDAKDDPDGRRNDFCE